MFVFSCSDLKLDHAKEKKQKEHITNLNVSCQHEVSTTVKCNTSPLQSVYENDTNVDIHELPDLNENSDTLSCTKSPNIFTKRNGGIGSAAKRGEDTYNNECVKKPKRPKSRMQCRGRRQSKFKKKRLRNVANHYSKTFDHNLTSKLTNLQLRLKTDCLVPKLRRLRFEDLKKHLQLSSFKLFKRHWNSENEISFKVLVPRIKPLELHSLEKRMISIRTLAPKLKRLKIIKSSELFSCMSSSNLLHKENKTKVQITSKHQYLSNNRQGIHVHTVQTRLKRKIEEFGKPNHDIFMRRREPLSNKYTRSVCHK